MDLVLTILIAALVFAAGWTAGRTYDAYLVRNEQISDKSVESNKVKPECWCGHIRSMHKDTKDMCLYRAKIFNNGKWHMTGCPCIQYDGPQPINEFYAPELEE